MNVLIKILVGAINFACLLVGLAFPNSATPMTILPPLVTSSSWIFTSARESKRINIPQLLLLVMSCIVGIGCFFLGATSQTVYTDNNMYLMKFHSNVAIVGGCTIPYDVLVSMVLTVFLALTFAEVVMSFSYKKKSTKNNTFDIGAEEKLCKITEAIS